MRAWCFDSQAVTEGGVTTYDREYGTEDIREVIGKLIGNGVYANPSTNMQVIADSGMTVKVQPGFCWIKGAFGAVDIAESLALDQSSSGRTDLVVARFDLSLSYRSIRLAVIKGTEGSTSAPNLIKNNSIHDIQLAKINVRAGATSILQSDITDTRYDSTVCGIVTGVINQIDTTNLFAQYQAAFNTFMAGLENTLTGDVAGNLLTLINNHKSDASCHASQQEKQTWDSKAAATHEHHANDIKNGLLPANRGGTGCDNYSSLRNNLGLGTGGALHIGCGGTGATTVENARDNLGIVMPVEYQEVTIMGVSESGQSTKDVTLSTGTPRQAIIFPIVTSDILSIRWACSTIVEYSTGSRKILAYNGLVSGIYVSSSFSKITFLNKGFPENVKVGILSFRRGS